MRKTNTMTKNNKNTKPVTKPVVIIKPEPMQWKHYD